MAIFLFKLPLSLLKSDDLMIIILFHLLTYKGGIYPFLKEHSQYTFNNFLYQMQYFRMPVNSAFIYFIDATTVLSKI